MYNLLVALIKGRALAILRGVSDGFEVWRQLVEEYEPHQAARCSQMLQGVLNPSWTSPLAFELDLRGWEGSLRRYEGAAGMQVPDQIKSAVIAQHVPKAIKRFIKMVPAYITVLRNAEGRHAILAFLTGDRAFTLMGLAVRDDDAMLVDAVEEDLQQEVNALGQGQRQGQDRQQEQGWQGQQNGDARRLVDASVPGLPRQTRGCHVPWQQAAGSAAQPRAPSSWQQTPQQAAAPRPSGNGKGKGGEKAAARAKGKGPSPATYCNRCGQWGHRSVTCRVVMGVFDDVWNPKNGLLASIHDSQA